MRPSSTIGFLGLLGMAGCLPTTNSTGRHVVDTESGLPQHAPTNLTIDNPSWDQELGISLFGLLRGPEDGAASLDLHAKDKHLETRVDPPPRDRKVTEQMKGLPECFQTCFRNENGKVGVDIYNWDLNTFCYGPTWIRTNTWILYHIYPCWKWQCRDHMQEIKYAGRNWMRETCP